MKVKILGVGIDNLSFDEAADKVLTFLKDGRKHYVVTPNPEIIMLSQKDKKLKEILNKADLAAPDGIGLLLAAKILGESLKERVTGTDLADKLCEMAAKKGLVVGFLGGRPGVAEKAAECQKERYSGLKVVFSFAGDFGHDIEVQRKIKPVDFLFVGYGASKQEYWIARNLSKVPAKVALGVGGALDYFAGKRIRAPKIVQNLGLEWFWRLLLEPWRFKRQLALPKFLFLVLKEKVFQLL